MSNNIPMYLYTYKNPSRCVIQLYDIIDYEEDNNVYYTVCVMIENDEPKIVRLLTDIIKNATIVGTLESSTVASMIRNSYRRDNKWQRKETHRINDIALYFSKL